MPIKIWKNTIQVAVSWLSEREEKTVLTKFNFINLSPEASHRQREHTASGQMTWHAGIHLCWYQPMGQCWITSGILPKNHAVITSSYGLLKLMPLRHLAMSLQLLLATFISQEHTNQYYWYKNIANWVWVLFFTFTITYLPQLYVRPAFKLYI